MGMGMKFMWMGRVAASGEGVKADGDGVAVDIFVGMGLMSTTLSLFSRNGHVRLAYAYYDRRGRSVLVTILYRYIQRHTDAFDRGSRSLNCARACERPICLSALKPIFL